MIEINFWKLIAECSLEERIELLQEASNRNIARSNRGLEELDHGLLGANNSLKLEMARQRGDQDYLDRYARFLAECDAQERGQI